ERPRGINSNRAPWLRSKSLSGSGFYPNLAQKAAIFVDFWLCFSADFLLFSINSVALFRKNHFSATHPSHERQAGMPALLARAGPFPSSVPPRPEWVSARN